MYLKMHGDCSIRVYLKIYTLLDAINMHAQNYAVIMDCLAISLYIQD